MNKPRTIFWGLDDFIPNELDYTIKRKDEVNIDLTKLDDSRILQNPVYWETKLGGVLIDMFPCLIDYICELVEQHKDSTPLKLMESRQKKLSAPIIYEPITIDRN